MPDKPGDGTSSPFGDGKGDSAMAAGKGVNFVTNPGGGSGSGGAGQPESYGESRDQATGSDGDVNKEDAASGPPTAAEVATPKAGGDIGTIAGKAVHVPFKGLK